MENQQRYDYIIVGSGFGGSVSALRLSEKGYKVAVIEKGKRYRNQDFPKSNYNIPKSIWMPPAGLHGTLALSLVRHALILHSCGVGGGSLIYANQLLVPPDEVFDKPEWGPGNWKEKLAPHYQQAQEMLGANPSPSVGKADKLLAEICHEYRGEDTFHKNDVGIFFGKPDVTVPDPYFDGKGPSRTGCTFCGACMIGCRVGAKNTLDKNYLYLAERLGATVIPDTEVTGVQPDENGYRISTKKSTGLIGKKKVYFAKGVVFSGGVMGSVKLLSKCKQKGWLPNISNQLGQFVRTNSEALLAVKSGDTSVDWNDQIAITSGVYPDDSTHVEIVRYGKGNDVLFGLLTLLTDGGGKIPRQLRFIMNIAKKPYQFLKNFWIPGSSARGSIVLVMQTDDNYLHFNYKRRWWRLFKHSINSNLPEGQKRAPAYIPIANEMARRLAKKMDGEPFSLWTEVLLDAPTTAHILGGCAMGQTEDQGVVDYRGEVFGHPNLFVADGSVIPANLGVNPSLTITALSEYIMAQMQKKPGY